MTLRAYKYQGAGNDFIVIDNCDGRLRRLSGTVSLTAGLIRALCDRHYGIGADGLMLLENSRASDFRMTYFNSDGSGGMMCGNGGRCIAAFAAYLGIPAKEDHYVFEAADGIHEAFVSGDALTVRLKMKDISEMYFHRVELDEASGGAAGSGNLCLEGWFVDTGTRHFVTFVDDTESLDIEGLGRRVRYSPDFAPAGVNVNFVRALAPAQSSAQSSAESDSESSSGGSQSEVYPIAVRTYEKGVEAETYACGTGITASAIAAFRSGFRPPQDPSDGRVHYSVKALRDSLSVDFIPCAGTGNGITLPVTEIFARDVWLTGPATRVAEMYIDI